MRIRSDGEQTRSKILEAACAVFGDKGYHKATFAAIGRHGDFNPALISFHFRSKDDLYRTVWKTLHDQVQARWPADGGLPSDAPAEDRLEAHVRSTLNRLSDPDLAALHRINMQERVSATGLLDDEVRNHIRELRAHMRGVLRDLLGQAASEEDVDLCEMSITNQLFVMRPPPQPPSGKGKDENGPGKCIPRFTRTDVDRLTDHITRFSLGGVAAIRKTVTKRDKKT